MICGVDADDLELKLHARHDDVDLHRHWRAARAVVDVLNLHCGQLQLRQDEMIALLVVVWS